MPLAIKSSILGFFLAILFAASSLAAFYNQAPKLSASGQSLSWSVVRHATSYEVEGQSGNKIFDYKAIKATRFTPTERPNSKVSYKVREELPSKSQWSRNVLISYGPEKLPEESQLEKAQHEKEATEKAQHEKETTEKAQHEKEATEKAQHEKEVTEKAQHEKEATEKAQHEKETPPTGNCTVSASSSAAANTANKVGAVVCLTSGTYSALSLTSSGGTVTAAPSAHVEVSGVNITGSNDIVSDLFVKGSINVSGSGSNDVIEHNDVSFGGYGISVLSSLTAPSQGITIAWNKIHDTSTTGEGDALRFDGWKNIKVIGNDIYNIKECPSACHTDTLQSYQAETPTSGLLVERNYVHDETGVQGLPFLKDGDIQEVAIRDNLQVRTTSIGQINGIWIDENTKGLTIEHNTSLGANALAANGSAVSPSATVEHNVFGEFNFAGKAYAMKEDDDVFTGKNEWSFTLGAHDVSNSSPAYKNAAADDYRLPGGQGVDWAPQEFIYGPNN